MALKAFSDKNVYFDVNIHNDTTQYKVASFTENRTVNILEKGSDYTMTIVRLFIPGSSIPIFVFTNSPHPFIIGIKKGANPIVNQQLIYDNTWNPTAIPAGAIWSYSQLCAIINTALTAITPIVNAQPPATLHDPPFIWFDTKTGTFKIRFANATHATDFTIYMNSALFDLFLTFPAKIVSFYSSTGNDVQLILDQNNPNNQVGTAFDLSQEVQTQYAPSGLRRVFLKSTLLNTRPEKQFQNEGLNISESILTDFEPASGGHDFRMNALIQYVPLGEFRRIDIINSNPVTNIDLKFYWQDKWGQIYEVLLPPNQFISIKLLFEKKLKF
ncbi:MAG: hypothetical protein QW303_01040 [Nitrososphaerota archaeon]